MSTSTDIHGGGGVWSKVTVQLPLLHLYRPASLHNAALFTGSFSLDDEAFKDQETPLCT